MIDVRDFGAVGNGTTDDTVAVQSALNDAKGTERTINFPAGSYRCGSLDALRVRNISMEGYILSTATVGYGIAIGTDSNANVDTLFGSLNVRIGHANASNAALAGVDGVRIRGLARCKVRLMVDRFDAGVAVRPGKDGTQYVAFNAFDMVHTYGCRVGVHIENDLSGSGAGSPFVNENSWANISVNPVTNALAGDVIGIELLAGDNNLFVKPHLEGLAIPIWIKNAQLNKFDAVRLESSGPVVFGDGTAAGRAAGNIVTSLYTQGGAFPLATHQAPLVNFALPEHGAMWRSLRKITLRDWRFVGSVWTCAKLVNTISGDSNFSAATVDTAARTFELGSNHRGVMYVPVIPGDVIALDADADAPTVYATVQALDASKAILPALSAGALPYIGSRRIDSVANGSSGTTATFDVLPSNYSLGASLVGSNRSEVKFLGVQLRSGQTYRSVTIRKLARAPELKSSIDVLP